MTIGAAETGRAARLDVPAVQAALREEGADGWLLYDFRGINPIAVALTGGGQQGGHLATRRWYYLIPASGEPRALMHAIEPRSLAHLPGTAAFYSGRQQLEAGLTAMLSGIHRVAMEYSPGCAIPYIARVDAGTIELVRDRGVEVISSGNLVQRFVAVWDDAAIASHRTASEKLHRIKDQAFEAVARLVKERGQTSEYEIQQLMARWFEEEGLVSDAAPNVSAAENAGNPHYLPSADSSRRIGPGELVLLDLWGKLGHAGAVYADITWMGFTGSVVPDPFTRAFTAVRAARDAGVALVRNGIRSGRPVHGWEVDRAASAELRAAGYAAQILHRTGHSLGQSVHGEGVNMDDYETHDDRRLLPGTGFTIEPGVYFPDFGVRSEINIVVDARDAVVTGPLQHEILTLV